MNANNSVPFGCKLNLGLGVIKFYKERTHAKLRLSANAAQLLPELERKILRLTTIYSES